MTNLCNCPNCQTDNCPAGAELEVLQKEVDRLRKDTPTADAIIWREACNKANQERDTLREQNAELRWACSEISTHLDSLDSALLIARAEACGDDVSYWEHEIRAHTANTLLIHQALATQPEKTDG